MLKPLAQFLCLLPFICLNACDSATSASPTLEYTEWSVINQSEDAVSFVAFGDWGTGDNIQLEVADAIGTHCAEYDCDFILSLGDNFYPSGVTSTDDPQWQSKFVDVYGDLGLPFYTVLGNHDTNEGGSAQAQIDYSLLNPMWILPSANHVFSWPLEEDPPLVEFFAVSTASFSDEEREWLANAILHSQATWKIIARHYPFLTNRNTGTEDDPLMEEAICNKTDLAISGHNHLFSILRGLKGTCWIEQVIVGTGGYTLQQQSGLDHDESRLITTAAVHGFGWFQVTSDVVKFLMVASDNNIVYSAQWTK